MSITTMKQALEALSDFDYDKRMAAITSLRQFIAEAEKQEPKCVVIVEVFGKDWRLEYMSLPVGKHKLYAQQYLYTHPQPKQEQVIDNSAAIRIATALGWEPKREWVGLTDEEIQIVVNKVASGEYQYSDTFARAIEAKLKQKNSYTEEKNT